MKAEVLQLQKTFCAAKERANARSKTEVTRVARGRKAWRIYDSPISVYDRAFSRVLDGSLGSALEKRKSEKGKVFALDVMGTARFSDVATVDAEAGITLVDFRSPEQQVQEAAQKRFIFPGQALSNTPWLESQGVIDCYDDTDFPGFDVVTFRPIGGWNTVRDSEKESTTETNLLEWIIMQRMVNLLSPSGGLLFHSFPLGSNYTSWIESVNETPHIEASYDPFSNMARFTKGNSDVVKLPKLHNVNRPPYGFFKTVDAVS